MTGRCTFSWLYILVFKPDILKQIIISSYIKDQFQIFNIFNLIWYFQDFYILLWKKDVIEGGIANAA